MKFVLYAMGKKKALTIFFTTILGNLIDAFGIVLIYPLIELIYYKKTSIDFVQDIFNLVINHFNMTPDGFSRLFLFASALFYFFRFVFFVFNTKWLITIYGKIQKDMCDQLFKGLLQANDKFISSTSLSESTATIHGHSINAVIFIKATVTLASEVFFVVMILVLFVMNYTGIAIKLCAIFTIITVIFCAIIVPQVKKYGRLQAKISDKKYHFTFNILNMIKDIKVMNIGNQIDADHRVLSLDHFKNDTAFKFIQNLPRHFFEFSIYLLLIAFMYLLTSSNLNINELAPQLGMACAALIRLSPAYGRIINQVTEIKYYKESVNSVLSLQKKLTLFNHVKSDKNILFNKELSIENICFKYEKHLVLDSVSLTIKKGQKIGIIGKTGEGKTTLLDVIFGMKKCDTGSFKADGIEFSPYETNAMNKLVGYVPQHTGLADASIAYNITLGNTYNKQKLERAIQLANLGQWISSLPQGYDTSVGENGTNVSGGQRQRIGIARALYKAPQIIFFDESTSALDVLTEKQITSDIYQLSSQDNITSVFITHRIKTIEKCDVIYILKDNKIFAQGNHSDLLANCAYYQTLVST